MNLRLAQTRESEVGTRYSCYGYDGHGKVRFLTDESGQITDTYDYDPPSPEGYGATGAFGNVITRYGTTPNNYLYCGEQFEPDLGLYFLRARYTDTERGRFWTMDVWEGPLAQPQALNRYTYVHADPVNWTDPTGWWRLSDTMEAQFIRGLLEKANVTLKSERALRTVTSVCKAAKAIAGSLAGVAGVYVILGTTQAYVGSTMNLQVRLETWASSGTAVGDLIKTGAPILTFAIDTKYAAEAGGLARLLRVVEQVFMDQVSMTYTDATLLNVIRARQYRKFMDAVGRVCK